MLFKTFIAEYTRMKSGKHSGGIKIHGDQLRQAFETDQEAISWWNKNRWMNSYLTAYKTCTNNESKDQDKTALLVLYENLKENKVNELKRIAKYLGAFDENRFKQCVEDVENMEGSFHRTNHIEENLFNKTAVLQIQAMVKTLNETLKILPSSYLVNPFE